MGRFWWRLWLLFLLWIVFTAVVMTLAAQAHDDGSYAQADPELHRWFNSLSSGKGLCCSFADGRRVEDVDWDTDGGHYRVRIDGKWIVVPDSAVVAEPNRAGVAIVWPYLEAGEPAIRCFMPGSGT